MQKKAGTAGIFSIVSGALGIFGWGLYFLGPLIMINLIMANESVTGDPSLPPEEFRLLFNTFYSYCFLYVILVGGLGIVGGVFALKKKHWAVALAGAIAGLLTFFPCGIAATILTIQAYNEFSDNNSPEVIS